MFLPVSGADPGSGAFLTLDPRWVKSQDPYPGSGMNNSDHIYESLETIFSGGPVLKFFDLDPGSGMEKIGIRDPG